MTSTPICDDHSMSQRDLEHVLSALWRRSGGEAAIAVDVGDINEDIGRGHRDMRTALNLQALQAQGLVVALDDGAWALSPSGVARVLQDRELSDR
jgi:hypothetical protein